MKTKSVIIIDDSEMDQYIAKHMIEGCDADIEILQAYDGQEALEILEDLPTQPDIIFLDINMPRMNGHEFLEEYNKWKKHSDSVIMLTSSDQEGDKDKALSYQCVKTYCTKPIERTALEALIA